MNLSRLFRRGPNKKLLRKWVEALRSGEYAQGYGALTSVKLNGDKAYCCLGVACVVAMENGLNLSVRESTDRVRYDTESGLLPKSVQKFFRFGSDDPYVGPLTRATRANDSELWDFNKIADSVEKYYKL